MERKYLGVIGNPIEHSLSPHMHNAALERQKPEYTYLPFRVSPEGLQGALEGFKALGVVGFNVTIPHKVAIMRYLDKISREARLIGAVNTVHLEDGQWVGYNTDGIGFLTLLERDGGVRVAGRQILLLGAGGAARAVAVQLGLAGVREITIANRTVEKAEALARELQEKIPATAYHAVGFSPAELSAAIADAEIIVNATPVGMSSFLEENLPLQVEWFIAGQVVVDLVYRPQWTNFLQLAKSAGCRTIPGTGMLLYQGVRSYQIWLGLEPPIEAMREALLSSLEGPLIRSYRLEDEAEWLNCWGQVVVTSHAWSLLRQTKPVYRRPAVKLVAIDGGKIIGFIDIEVMVDNPGTEQETPPYGFAWEFGVLPHYRGRGIGRRMIEAAATILLETYSVKRMEFWSMDPDSQRYYTHLGMQEISRHNQFIIKPDKAIKEFFKPGAFLPWFIYGSCDIDKMPIVEEHYKVDREEPAEPHVCIGYNYWIVQEKE